jgi:ubiquinol-cytochrome c reductase iron-sulfur subunit
MREVIPGEYVEEEEAARGERWAIVLFALSILGTLGFLVAYTFMKVRTQYGAYQNWVLGTTLAVSLFGIGWGMIVWAKKVVPHEEAMAMRHDGASAPEEREATEEEFLLGAQRIGIRRRKLLFSAAGAMGLFPLSFVFALRDLGPAPGKELFHTTWAKGKRLVDVETKLPVRLGDLAVGAIKTVMPEGFDKLSVEATNLDPTMLIRLRPEEIRSAKERSWGYQGYVAYSKICSHAGCPISLYEQQTHNLFCPCHQSTFKMTEDAKVIFGPAARPLPQLRIGVDDQGYIVALGPYSQPVGPSFWERG